MERNDQRGIYVIEYMDGVILWFGKHLNEFNSPPMLITLLPFHCPPLNNRQHMVSPVSAMTAYLSVWYTSNSLIVKGIYMQQIIFLSFGFEMRYVIITAVVWSKFD